MTGLLFRASWRRTAPPLALIALVSTAGAGAARGQSSARSSLSVYSNVIIPQSRVVPARRGETVLITAVTARVSVVEQAATTTLDIRLRNPGPRRLESELLVPVPDEAVVRGFNFDGAAKEPTARLLGREEARRIYDAIVARARDPALLEFAGYNLIRSSVFPVEPRSTQRVRLTYENLLPSDGTRVDYVLPRSESLGYRVPWDVSVDLRAKREISTVYSPSHDIETARSGAGRIIAKVRPAARGEPGAFRLSWILREGDVTASFFAYPDPRVGGGYFLLLAGLPPIESGEKAPRPIPREVTLVIDRSGSMRGEKLEQVREAALQIIAGLDDGEAFNVILYNEAVELFSPQPVVKGRENEARARAYLAGMRARGGTNIHDALLESLRQKATPGRLPIVLFLTDGLPTVGQTSEVAIRRLAEKSNPDHRRVFTFGVGVDVNTPLLERVASLTRATPTFVLPKEDVEVKVAGVFRRLSGPVLASPRIDVLDAAGSPATSRIRDLVPGLLPDLFDGDQLVLLGQWSEGAPLRFRLRGNYFGRERTFQFTFDPSTAKVRNAFVPRLWASRKIATLEDAIRDLGAGTGGVPGQPLPPDDPRLRELVDEIVRLSTEFGILSEYTAFLAEEGTELADLGRVRYRAGGNFVRRSLGTRRGISSVNQDLNRSWQKSQKILNYGNTIYDRTMKRVSITGVRQVADKAFFRRGGRWVDSLLVQRAKEARPGRVVEFASDEYRALLGRLVAEGRQGYVSLPGEILMLVDGETVLVRGPAAASALPAAAEAAGKQTETPR